MFFKDYLLDYIHCCIQYGGSIFYLLYSFFIFSKCLYILQEHMFLLYYLFFGNIQCLYSQVGSWMTKHLAVLTHCQKISVYTKPGWSMSVTVIHVY